MVISQLSQSLQPLLRVVGGQAGELRKFQVAKGPRKLGVGCAQEGSGEEGEGSQMTMPIIYPVLVSRANSVSNPPAPHHCLFLRGA